MTSTLVQEVVAMLMVGDGLIGIAYPQRHVERWTFGPQVYKRSMDTLAHHPGVTRFLAGVEVAFGMWWAGQLISNGLSVADDAELSSSNLIPPDRGPSGT